MDSVAHDQEGRGVFDTILQYPHDVWMLQVGDGAGFHVEALHSIGCQLGIQDLDGGLCAQVNMLTKVDFGEAPPSHQANKAVVAKLLAHTVNHAHISFEMRRNYRITREALPLRKKWSVFTILYLEQICNLILELKYMNFSQED